MKTYINVMDKFNVVLKVILGLLLFIALITLSLQVFSRFVLNVTPVWASELAKYLMVWITFIGGGLAVRYQKLIRLEFLFTMFTFKPAIEKVIKGLAAVITMAFCVIILMYSVQILEIVHNQKSPALQIPMSIPYLAISVGSLIMIFNTLASMFEGETEEKT